VQFSKSKTASFFVCAAGVTLTILPADGQLSEVIGYRRLTVAGTHGEAGKVETFLGVGFASKAYWTGTCTQFSDNVLTTSRNWSDNFFTEHSGEYYLEITSGAAYGATLDILGNGTTRLIVEDVGPLPSLTGCTFRVRKHPTLDEYFSFLGQPPILTGTDAAEADNVVLWEPRSQTARTFYRHQEDGAEAYWREAGQSGDRGGTRLVYPSAFIFIRRAAEDFIFTELGNVPATIVSRLLSVWPGTNLLATIVVEVSLTNTHFYTAGSPFSVVTAPQATAADRLTFYQESRARLGPIYYRLGGEGPDGWRLVGSSGVVGDRALPGAFLLDRVGERGYVRMDAPGLDVGSPQARGTAPELVAASLRSLNGTLLVEWSGAATDAYQVQSRPSPIADWTDAGPLRSGASDFSVAVVASASRAEFRVIRR
jgi:uncharacterized protein (TIGR02597 family)